MPLGKPPTDRTSDAYTDTDTKENHERTTHGAGPVIRNSGERRARSTCIHCGIQRDGLIVSSDMRILMRSLGIERDGGSSHGCARCVDVSSRCENVPVRSEFDLRFRFTVRVRVRRSGCFPVGRLE